MIEEGETEGGNEEGPMPLLEQGPSSEHWKEAQISEKKFWEHSMQRFPVKEKAIKDLFIHYSNRRMKELFDAHGEHNKPNEAQLENKFILEMGSGPIPFITCWNKAKYRLAIDPLFSYYKQWTKMEPYQKNLGVHFWEGKIEDFTFWRKRQFDILIMSNCLDHCDNPVKAFTKALDHMNYPNGVFYFDNYIRKPFTIQDKAHPHGWENLKVLEQWMAKYWGHLIKADYVRVMGTQRPRIYMRLSWQAKKEGK